MDSNWIISYFNQPTQVLAITLYCLTRYTWLCNYLSKHLGCGILLDVNDLLVFVVL